MIELATRCTRCGDEFTPAHDDYVRGCWRICPACRDGPPSQGAGSRDGPSQSLSGQSRGSSVAHQRIGIEDPPP